MARHFPSSTLPLSMLRTVVLLLSAAATSSTLLAEAGLSVSDQPCPEGRFHSPGAPGSCKACAACPKNQIIRVPCTPDSDTVCGPFIEFYEFHQASPHQQHLEDEGEEEEEQSDDRKSATPDESDDVARGGGQGRNQDSSVEDPESTSLPEDESSLLHLGSGRAAPAGQRRRRPYRPLSSSRLESTPSVRGEQQQEAEETQWKILALALIVVLCVVCIFLLVFVFTVCYLRAGSRATRAKNAALLEATDAGLLTGTGQPRQPVVTHYYVQVPVPPAHAHNTTSGSGERSHATSATASGQLQAEDSEDPGEEEEGPQDPTPGSEYVFFKSPHNGNVQQPEKASA